MNRVLQYTFGIIFSICLMIVLFITSIEASVYWIPGYFEKEYRKYNVTEIVSMDMEDLLEVTDEMMSYLRGNRKDLHVSTTMGGVEWEFFNDREIAHMEDVKNLFLEAVSLRNGCVITMILCILVLFLLKTKFKNIFPKSICIGSGIFFLLSAIITIIISTDFNRYFIMFHEIFFDNDLWILNPDTDMLINIVPEGFFMDTASLFGSIFLTSVLVVIILCLFFIFKHGKNSE